MAKLDVKSICSDEHIAWKSWYYTAYGYSDEEGNRKTVFRCAVPFDGEQEAILMDRFGITGSGRMGYYQQLLRCVQRQMKVSEYLRAAGVPSILVYDQVETERDDNGVTYLYLQTREVVPVKEKLFSGSVNIVTALDVFLRLMVILRDISKDPYRVTHRCLDLNEVYLTSDEKILLGGFYYAGCPDLGEYQDYLPEAPRYLPKVFRQGLPGTQADDLRTLAMMLYNLFSGIPMDAVWDFSPVIAPEYALDELSDVIQLGLHCTDGDCNTFRRRLMDCRKRIAKSEFAGKMLPVSTQMRKQRTVQFI